MPERDYDSIGVGVLLHVLAGTAASEVVIRHGRQVQAGATGQGVHSFRLQPSAPMRGRLLLFISVFLVTPNLQCLD